jgi:hypothetical protein
LAWRWGFAMSKDDAYRAAHLQAALADDPRVHELELDVLIRAGRAQVTGVVATNDRRDAVRKVLADLAPDLEIDNLTTVAEYARDPSVERMR